MAEETTRVPPASPVIKSRAGEKRRSFESLRSSISSEKGIPNYLRASTGSCHEICKHGKPEAHANEAKESRPWRKPVTGNGRDILHTNESGATAVIKKTVVVKPKPAADPKILSSSRETRETASERVDVHTEQASSDMSTSDGTKTTSPSEEKVKQEISVASENVVVPAEEASIDIKDLNLSKKSSTFSKVKPSLRSPSPIFIGSNAERRRSLDVRKSFEGRRSIDGRKNVEGRKSIDGRKHSDEHKRVDTETAQKCDLNSCSAENNIEGSKNADEMNSIEGSNIAPEKKGSEGSESLNLETHKKDDDSLENSKNNTKSELLNTHIAAPKPKILTKKPSSSLNHSTLKPPSPVNPSSGSRSRTSDDNQAAEKFSTSKLDAKKVGKPTTVSPSSRPSVSGEENTVTKKVRTVRVVSSVRRQIKSTKVEAKDPYDQGVQVQEDTADANKISPERESLANAKIKVASSRSLLPPAHPSTSKSTVRSRITYAPSRLKKSLGESEPKVAAEDASTSCLRKGKAVDPESENHRPSKLRVRSSTLIRETAKIKPRSLKKRDITGRADVQKNSSESFLLRRPSIGGKKNVQVLFNKVIEETASRLVRTRKSKVLALVGAFETVISIQKKSLAGTKPKAKKVISSSKPLH